ncbi:acyl-CoA thioesterase [Terasakiella pusilla]|jgi:YbgC/YbaW family acyl-CoA thioester hydrolase|uniref:acyl-CoA thioesterase n=1 Tax=Terasakiella pusilla TaxID=64973 RepID=UPI003AA94D74
MTVPFTHSRPILWGDTDAANIAYTVRFLDYCLEAIEEWFKGVCNTDWYVLNMDRSTGTPFVNANIDFKAPLTPRNKLHTQVLIKRLGTASITFHLRGLRDDDVVSFEAQLTCCFVNNKEMTSIPIPDDFRQNIESYIEAGGTVQAAGSQ